MSELTTADAVREEVRAWLDENWDPSLDDLGWRRVLLASGWALPTWPAEWFGRGLDKDLARVVAEEFNAREAPGLAVGGGIGAGMAAPTILAHGTDVQRRRYIPPIFTGEEVWCQLFSEPGSGSDLAGSTARADRHGDEWIINGQKVWTSGAEMSDYGLLLCRTNWDVPKHQGLSYFLLPMRQVGVEVRPLRQMTGGAAFNEVFFTDARVPHENLLGELNDGWSVALTTLMHERASMGGGGGVRVGGQPRTPPPQQMGEFSGLAANPIEAAKRNGRAAGDPVLRQDLMRLYTLQRISLWNAQRSRAAEVRGTRPGPEGSLGKLTMSAVSRLSARLSATVAGAEAMVQGPAAAQQLSYHAMSIAGGTDDIQRNIVGERVLGLPKDPQVDAGIPFREVRTNSGAARR